MNTIDTKLVTLIAGMAGGETVILANPNAPQPSKPFWMVRLQSTGAYGMAEHTAPNATGTAKVIQTKRLTVNVQRFSDVRGSSLEKLQDFKLNLEKTSVRNTFAAQKIVAYDSADVQDVTALLDNAKYEDRASIDVFIGYRASTTDNVGLIETVKTEYDDYDKSPIVVSIGHNLS